MKNIIFLTAFLILNSAYAQCSFDEKPLLTKIDYHTAYFYRQLDWSMSMDGNQIQISGQYDRHEITGGDPALKKSFSLTLQQGDLNQQVIDLFCGNVGVYGMDPILIYGMLKAEDDVMTLHLNPEHYAFSKNPNQLTSLAYYPTFKNGPRGLQEYQILEPLEEYIKTELNIKP